MLKMILHTRQTTNNLMLKTFLTTTLIECCPSDDCHSKNNIAVNGIFFIFKDALNLWLNGVYYATFNRHTMKTAHIIRVFHGFTSTREELWSVLPKIIPTKNPVRLKPRTPGLQVKHFATEPRKTSLSPSNALPHNPKVLRPCRKSLLKTLWEKEKMLVTNLS